MNRPESIHQLSKRIHRMQMELMRCRVDVPNVIEPPAAYNNWLKQNWKGGKQND